VSGTAILCALGVGKKAATNGGRVASHRLEVVEALTVTSAELVDCSNLVRGSLIDVETKSRHYRIECLGGNAIRISGHPEYCPDPVPAQLHGSVNKEGELELGLIGRGMRLMVFLNDRRPVTTSRVLHVRVDQPKVARPTSSPSIH
jgi:hypothetical protein